jgi:tetratricopeptide (TPR) repeat protein
MSHTNRSALNAQNPVRELEQRLLLASTAEARLDVYLRYIPEVVAVSPTEALSFAGKAYRTATELRDWTRQAEILRLRASAHMVLDNPAAALDDLREAYAQARDGEDRLAVVRISIAIGEALAMQGEPVEALVEYQRSLDMCGTDPTDVRADLLESLGNLHFSTGDYARAIEHLRQSLAMRTMLDDRDGLGRALGTIGMAFGRIGDLATAYKYHRQSLEAFRATGDVTNQIRALANMAAIHQTRGELQDALELVWRAHAASETNGDSTTLASLKATIGELHMKQREPDLALKYFLESYQLLQNHPDDDLLLQLCSRIGSYHESLDDLDAAQLVYRHAIETAERTGRRAAQVELHRAMSRVFERKGFHREALDHYQRYTELQLELAGEEQRRQIAEVQTKYDMLKMEQDLARESERADRAEEDRARTEKENVMLRMDLYGVKTRMKKTGEPAERGGEGSRAIAKQGRRPDGSSRKKGPDDDLEWDELRRQIDKAHPGFIDRLYEACPALTVTEVKICSLTRLLKDDSNEIARVLHNGLRTLQTQRAKIRKKLGLGRDVNFAAYIDRL